MDKRFDLKGISFVWDSDKARKNLAKHDGVTFEQAAEAFFDPFLRLVDADTTDETRDAVIGRDDRWNLLFVIHMAFEDERIRIISARKATRRERSLYES